MLVTAAWVLAGGRSSRMGSDKALLEFDGLPLVMRAVRAVSEVCETVSVVGDPARYAALGLPVVADEFVDAGPLAGIEAALRTTVAEWNLVVACDMPAIEAAILASLFTAASEGDCALPRYPDGKTEPLCAVYSRRCHPHIRAALEAGVRKVTAALEGLAIRYVPVTREHAFTNLNTPEDVRRYFWMPEKSDA